MCFVCCRASGASTLAYWLGNFLFDFTLMFLYILAFCTVLAMFNSHGNYTDEGFSYVLAGGFFFIITSIFRYSSDARYHRILSV